jgi:hypothetical protein
MKSKLSAALGTALLSAVVIPGAPAIGDNITTHQWFDAQFGGVGSSVSGPGGVPMVNGPLSGGGTGNTIDAPATTVAVGTCVSPHAPRTEPYVRLSRIRLPPRVCDGKLPYAFQRL